MKVKSRKLKDTSLCHIERSEISLPLTDLEHELMLKEADESPNMLPEEAEAHSEELIKKWSRYDT